MPRPPLPSIWNRRGFVALALAASVALLGCGDGADRAAPSEEPSSSSTTTTSTSSSTVPDEEAEGTGGGGGCEATAEIRGDPVPDPPVVVDADADGRDDEVTVTVVDDRTIEVVVAFGAGGRSVTIVDDDSVATFAAVRAERAADVDGDGDDDVWVVVGAGASVEVVSLFLADGCDLVRPVDGSTPNQFPVGASVGYLSGIECVDGVDGFVEHVAENVGGTTYRGTSTTWRIGGDGTLTRDGTAPLEVDLSTEDGSRYATLDCG